MDSMDPHVTKALYKLSQDIRKKYKALKLGRAEEDIALNKFFKPIIEPLTKISNSSSSSSSNLTKTISKKSAKHKKVKKSSSPSPLHLKDDNDDDISSKEIDNENNLSFPTFISSSSPQKNIEEGNVFEDAMSDTSEISEPAKLVEEYTKGYLNDSHKEKYDTEYGLKYNPKKNQWLLGNASIKFDTDSDDFIIDSTDTKSSRGTQGVTKTFKGTKGLYELLFKKEPDPLSYTKDDEKNYDEILKLTNVYKRNFEPTGYTKYSNLPKYRNIIRPLVVKTSKKRRSKSFAGSGIKNSMLEYNSNAIDYRYWDDPNELVDRLKLLMASTQAGNTSLTNEMLSIIEELIEAGIIKEANSGITF